MSINIKLHKNDLPDDLKLGNVIAVDGEFMGLDVRRDPLCLIQISTGNDDESVIWVTVLGFVFAVAGDGATEDYLGEGW